MKNTLTEENYLKALFHLTQEKDFVQTNELSKLLSVKMPSVNSMMKKFGEKNWVTCEPYKPIFVTDLGKKEAALVVRKHRLTEMFLVEKMQFSWDNVHEIAEQLEHVHSQLFFDKMDELLNFPKNDPHGESIPDKNGFYTPEKLIKLSDCNENEVLIIRSVDGSDDNFLKILTKNNLKIGSKIMIFSKENAFNSLIILPLNEKIRLKNEDLDKIHVKKADL